MLISLPNLGSLSHSYGSRCILLFSISSVYFRDGRNYFNRLDAQHLLRERAPYIEINPARAWGEYLTGPYLNTPGLTSSSLTIAYNVTLEAHWWVFFKTRLCRVLWSVSEVTWFCAGDRYAFTKISLPTSEKLLKYTK